MFSSFSRFCLHAFNFHVSVYSYSRPDRIALDHSTGNIYYTGVSDYSYFFEDSYIGVLGHDGSHTYLVESGLDPRDIVIDSSAG